MSDVLTFWWHWPQHGQPDVLVSGASRVGSRDNIHALVLKVGVVDEEGGVCQLDEPLPVQWLAIARPAHLTKRRRGGEGGGDETVGNKAEVYPAYFRLRSARCLADERGRLTSRGEAICFSNRERGSCSNAVT